MKKITISIGLIIIFLGLISSTGWAEDNAQSIAKAFLNQKDEKLKGQISGAMKFSDLLARVMEVNDWVNNRIMYQEKEKEYWPITQELGSLSKENCVGMAIAKYGILRDVFKIPINQLTLIVLERERDGSRHMVLAWYPSGRAGQGEAWILDNGGLNIFLFPGSANGLMTFLPAHEMMGWKPLVGFNEETIWKIG